MNKKLSFTLHIFVLTFSSILLFIYHLLLLVSPFITIPNVPKEIMYVALFFGYMLGVLIMIFAVSGLWRMGTKVTIVPPKIIELPPLDKQEFGKLCDDIKDTNIGQEMMNHVKECQRCTEMSMALNNQVSKHIEETGKLT